MSYEFPRPLSKNQATTQQPSHFAAESTEGQIAEQTAKVAGVAQEGLGKLAKAYSEAQKTQAELNQRTQIDDLLARAEADPDYNSYEKYKQENEKINKESTSGFKNPITSREAKAKADYYSRTSDRQLQNIFHKKMIDNQQANLLGLLDKDAAVGDIEGIKSRIEKNKNEGFINATDAYNLEQKYIKKTKQNAFISDLAKDPSLAEENLSKNIYGFDSQEFYSAKKTIKSEIDKMQAVTQNDLLTSYLNGDAIDSNSVKELMNQKRIDPKFAESLIEKIENPKPDELSQDEAYIEFQNRGAEALEKGDKASIEEVVKLMADTMRAHGNGLLDKSDVQRILKDRNEILQKKLEGKAEEIMSKTHPKTFLERITFWADEYAGKKPDIKARMYRNLMDGIMQGADPNDALTKVTNDEIEIQLRENLKKPESDLVKMMSPDGVMYEIPKENVEKAKKRGFTDAG